jgi:hypothetical protein
MAARSVHLNPSTQPYLDAESSYIRSNNPTSAYGLAGADVPVAYETELVFLLSVPVQADRLFSERRPLLSRPVTPNHNSYLLPTGSVSSRIGQTSSNVSTPLLHNLGWIEYVLPDASAYYVHPTLRVTTDVDLRNTKKLEAVTAYFDNKSAGAPVGLEIWLQELVTTKRGSVPTIFWVDHRKRSVASDPPMTRDGAAGKSKHTHDDRKF